MMVQRNAQKFQHQKFAVYRGNDFLRYRKWCPKADPVHTIMVPKGKYDPLYIVCHHAVAIVSVKVIYDDQKWR